MPKIHRCNKINDKGEVCNETDFNKFSDGRYSTCIKCRLRSMSEYNKSKTKEKPEKFVTKIDPDNYTRELIQDTILKIPLLNKKTIPDKIRELDVDISNIYTDYDKKFQDFEHKMSLLQDENIKLKLQLLSYKEHIQKILNEKL